MIRESWRLGTIYAPEAASDAAFGEVVRRYSHPDQHYHNLDHIGSVIAAVWPFRADGKIGRPLLLSAILHDVIYDPRAKDNEERSADYARELLGGLGAATELREEVARLILLTRNHQAEPNDPAGVLLTEADLLILSSFDPGKYDDYAAKIRLEYNWVPEQEYRNGRKAVLQRLLDRPYFYRSPFFKHREPLARANLAREIASLS